MKHRILLPLLCSGLMLLTACSETQVRYADPNQVDTVSADFSSTDLQTIARSMTDQMLAAPAIVAITNVAQKDQPVVFVSNVQNRSDQHIDTQAITDTISTELLNSGKFRFVDPSVHQDVMAELKFQQDSGLVDPKTAVKIGKQVGAKYMLYGSITNITRRNDDMASVYYLFTLKLLNIQSGLITWQGQKQIRKIETQSTFGY